MTVLYSRTTPDGQTDLPVEESFFDLTDAVAGTPIRQGETVAIDFQVPIDYTVEATHTVLVTMVVLDGNGRECIGTGVSSHTGGGLPEVAGEGDGGCEYLD